MRVQMFKSCVCTGVLYYENSAEKLQRHCTGSQEQSPAESIAAAKCAIQLNAIMTACAVIVPIIVWLRCTIGHPTIEQQDVACTERTAWWHLGKATGTVHRVHQGAAFSDGPHLLLGRQ